MSRARRPGASRARTPTWSGRIAKGLDSDATELLNAGWDEHLIGEADILASVAHVRALQDAGILTTAEARRLTRTLEKIESPYRSPYEDEDVHSALERAVTDELGDLGAKLHTGRSRNDLVATDLRLWTREAVLRLTEGVLALVAALVHRASETETLVCPGYTHLQRGQPVTVGHLLLAHAFALERDVGRLLAAHDTADASSLGAGALAGNTLGIRPEVSAEALGFSRVFDNTVDAVSSRDFLTDVAYAHASAAVHLSRLAEEIVIWSTAEFGFVRPPDGFSSGSSMMPQKRNPDVAEVARAQAGQATGTLVDLLMTMKGLALAYDRDLQAVKRALTPLLRAPVAFEAMAGMVRGLSFDAGRLREAASDDFLLATDLAEALVLQGVPFRRAHEMVGALAAAAERAGSTLREALDADQDALSPLAHADAVALLDPSAAVERRRTPGGPSRTSVRTQIRKLRRVVAGHRRRLDELTSRLPSRGRAAPRRR